MCLCRTKVPHPPHPASPPPPLPKNNHTVNRRQCCETFQASCKRAKHLATCQLPCNLTTSSTCAIFGKLQEKIRSIASRPAQKVTGKSSEQSIKSVSQAACACVGQKFPSTSPPPHLPPNPHPKNNHTVIRPQCCETFQSSFNVPSILQRANYLATSQHLLNTPSVTSYKRKFGA